MSDQRPDDETLGRALGRAVESQSVSETPFVRSRLSSRVDRPARGGWMGTLVVAAALGLFVAMGAFFVRGPYGVANPNPSGSPDRTARPTLDLSAVATPRLSANPTASAALVRTRVYFARDGLPPVGADVMLAVAADRTAEQRIGARLGALITGLAQSPSRATSAVDPRQIQSVDSVRVLSGDTALVDLIVNGGDWGVRGAAQTQALLQQLVYTATEEAGIKSVRFTENGGKTPMIDQVVIDKPLSREDALRYGFLGTKESRVSVGDSNLQPRAIADWRASVDDVRPGLTRFVVEFVGSALAPGGFAVPRFTADLQPNTNAQQVHKWELRVTMPDAIWPEVARTGTPFACCAVKPVDRTPLRSISAGPESAGNARGVIFTLALDDARPWRTTVLQSPLRLVIDIGGAQQAVSESVAVYAPASGTTVSPRFTVSGLARAFEANVSWRVRASSGSVVASGFTTASIGTGPIWGSFQTEVALPSAVSGRVTLEVFWTSPRDGSDTGLVSIPLEVR